MHLPQLHLHILPHLGIESREGLVEEQDLRLVDYGTGYGDTLLLSAGEGGDIALLIVCHAHHLQGVKHTLVYLVLAILLQLQPEGDIVIYREIGEEGILLEHSVHRTAVWRYGRYVLALKEDMSGGRMLESCYHAQECCLATA